ncbi:unnamed protein product [Adineta steineri]|uniref:Micro-fibrillar-associated protein 1 C-terminal domain-containing protein n=1 Tax=Adineta steineri TaxID=433720 RepID=A0A818VP17_9BILA|nr:unnamed protein product [Adineta steineri]CAF1285250.1 unnamed protein product [Adineta steineri]CAF3683071.1 unnamed protein product [Adineta steineri]CAF3713789.1 unnamed protein product [Adineta steineri]
MIDIDEGFFKAPSLSTAGAISVRNAKGQLVTQKVKVHRYVAGKRPDFAGPVHVSDDEDEEEQQQLQEQPKAPSVTRMEQEDRRIRRLQAREVHEDDDERDRIHRHRRIIDPEILQQSSEDEEEEEQEQRHDEEEEDDDDDADRMDLDDKIPSTRVKMDIESSDDDEEMNEEEIERRRQRLLMKAKEKEEELLQVEDEKEPEQEESEPSEESESEEEDEEEDDDGMPRLKPVFVRKTDRRTVAERKAEEKHEIQLEIEQKRLAHQRKMQTKRIVEEAIKQEEMKKTEESGGIQCDFNTDDEDGEVAYDAWKLRELERLKRDRKERDEREREQQELERWRNMTEEERQAELRKNGKTITNAAPKAKYKFLQKYYHRGAFFMDKDEDILKRDYSAPTLEDHFNKTILPKVMQVKNFGMAGRTKYTHLVDQDTTSSQSRWASDKQSYTKFHQEHGGGLKQVFERPKLKNTTKKTH